MLCARNRRLLRPPLDELHREEPVVAVTEKLALRDEARMSKPLKRAKLPLEAVEPIRLGVTEDLERDSSTVAKILRLA